MRKVVLDIETIPCHPNQCHLLRPIKPPLEIVSKKELARWQKKLLPRLREEQYQKTALDWTLGRIVCIGLLVVQDGSKPKDLVYAVKKEDEVLPWFWDKVRLDDFLIGYNLLSFDLPFIQFRSLLHGITPKFRFNLRRYCETPVFDVMQVWANWDRTHYAKLEVLAQVFGLGGKVGKAEDVYKWWKAGKLDKIERYCMADVRLTWKIYQRMQLLVGGH